MIDRENRSWIRREIAALIEAGGPEPFVERPIVQPDEAFFPEKLMRDIDGLTRLARTLARHAELDLETELLPADPPGIEPLWLVDVEGGHCRIGVALTLLAMSKDTESDPAGAVSLALAEAYRRLQGFTPSETAGDFRSKPAANDEERRMEQAKIGVAAIYLGFGILTANHSHRWVHGRPGPKHVDESVAGVGLLSVPAIGYALAVQLAVRRVGFWERRKLTRHLEPDPKAYFDDAWARVSPRSEKLARSLGVAWPA